MQNSNRRDFRVVSHMDQNGMYDISDAHSIRNSGQRPNLIHNNVSDNQMIETVRIHDLLIDGTFRDPNQYNNPFMFPVRFGAVGKSIIRFLTKKQIENCCTARSVNNKKFIQENLDGYSGVKVTHPLKNVQQIRLECLFLPISNVIRRENGKYQMDRTASQRFENSRYLILKIGRIGTNPLYITDSCLDEHSFILYPDRCVGENQKIWIPVNPDNTFPNSNLFNLERMEIQLFDDQCEPISPILIDKNAECQFDIYRTLKEMESSGAYTAEEITSLIDIYRYMQMSLMFTIKTMQNRINTQITY